MLGCPRCGAGAGEPCVGVRGKRRESNHLERVEAATRAFGCVTREHRFGEVRQGNGVWARWCSVCGELESGYGAVPVR